jgi:sialic acid synthase SpsE
MNFNQLDRTWIIAEIGVNHEGDEAVAVDLIHKAKASGADAVKFQTFDPNHYVSSVQPDRLERVSKWALSQDAFRRLAALSRELGLVFFSTPLGFSDVPFLNEISPLFKISSGDLTCLPLIRAVARTGKPIIISTGLGTQAEIQAAIDTVYAERPQAATDGSLMLMHCVSAYPTPPDEAHVRNVGWLKEVFRLPTGYSDHTLGIKACELAVAAGAIALEKHFTYRKEDQTFHDHKLSADPKDMTELVAAVRQAETYLGSPQRARGPSEEKLILHMRRSIGAAIDIPAGEPVQEEWLTFLRPQWGITPDRFDAVVGAKLKRAIPKGDLIRDEDLP